MITAYAVVTALCSVAVALWALVLVVRNRAPGKPILAGIAVIELLLLAQVAISVVLMIGGERPGSMVTFLAYLVGSLLVLPIGTAWALAERSRSSTGVLAVACVTIPVLILRMSEVWSGAHA